MPTLFDPAKVGDLEIPNRIIMAPLTRCRASEGRVPNALNAEYYAQRASAGFILSEATSVTPMGVGYPDTPGIWSPEQVGGWKLVTKAVHNAGGRIFLQLWHVGRVSDPIYLDGKLPVSASAVAAKGHVSLVRPERPHVTPRALETGEIPAVIEDYRKGAENALAAGFDGVEIHGANGYLPNQFLSDANNFRTDEYGGSIENRARFLLEATDAAISVWGASRVGVHISPRGSRSEPGPDSDPAATFGYVAKELRKRNIAFLFARESLEGHRFGPAIREAFGGFFIANEEFTRETGEFVLATGEADAVGYGVPFIANPDLPRRFVEQAALNEPITELFYSPGMNGYTDYPALAA